MSNWPNPKRRGNEYAPGELETILSLVPTSKNIRFLSRLLDRTEDAIGIVYKIAYQKGIGKGIQKEKVLAAKKKVGITAL